MTRQTHELAITDFKLRHIYSVSIRHMSCCNSPGWQRITGDVSNPVGGTIFHDAQTLALKGRKMGSKVPITLWETSLEVNHNIIAGSLCAAYDAIWVFGMGHAFINIVPRVLWYPFVALLIWPLCENRKFHGWVTEGLWTGWTKMCASSCHCVVIVSVACRQQDTLVPTEMRGHQLSNDTTTSAISSLIWYGQTILFTHFSPYGWKAKKYNKYLANIHACFHLQTMKLQP